LYAILANIWHDHHYVRTAEEASAVALKAGCDQDGGITYLSLVSAVQHGLLKQIRINFNQKIKELM
jgi:hypothetical protein